MPEVILNCPQCQRQLRVTEDLLGRPVRCPACGLTFTVPADGGQPQPLASPPAASDVRPARPRPRADEEEPEAPRSRRRTTEEEYDEEEVRPRRRPREEEYEEEEEEYEERRPRRHRPRPWDYEDRDRGAGKSRVMAPAICLLVTGILGLLINLGQAIYVAVVPRPPVPAVAAPQAPPPDPAEQFRQEFEKGMAQGASGPAPLIMGALFAIVSALVIIAAIQMLRMRTHGFALAGAILAMIDFGNCCCLLGAPFGIWALVVLLKPEVKEAFH